MQPPPVRSVYERDMRNMEYLCKRFFFSNFLFKKKKKKKKALEIWSTLVLDNLHG